MNYKNIYETVTRISDEYVIHMTNKSGVSALPITHPRKGPKYLSFRNQVSVEYSKLEKALKRQLLFLKDDLGTNITKEITNCLNKTLIISDSIFDDLFKKQLNKEHSAYIIVYDFFITDCKKFNTFVDTFKDDESFLNFHYKGTDKNFFMKALYDLLSLYKNESDFILYSEFIDLIWRGQCGKHSLPSHLSRFLLNHSQQLTGQEDEPRFKDVEQFKSKVRLRYYRFERKMQKQNNA